MVRRRRRRRAGRWGTGGKEGEGRGRLMAQGQDGFWRQSDLQYLEAVRLAALRSSHEAESAWATA